MDRERSLETTSEPPRVSILIPTKDNLTTIFHCLESLTHLDYPREKLEILILDSSSPPLKLPENLRSYISIFHKKCSPPAAYNFLLQLAKGEIIAFIDSDAVADRLWLRELVAGFSTPEVGGVGGHIRTWNTANPLARCIGYELEGRYSKMPENILRISTSNLAVRREVLMRVGGIDENLPTGYDAKLGLDINALGLRLRFNPRAIVYHYHRPTLREYYGQQKTYALHDVRLYTKGFPARADNVTSLYMLLELVGWLLVPALGIGAAASAALQIAPVKFIAFYSLVVLVGILLAGLATRGTYVALTKKDPYALLYYPAMLATRSFAWIVGGLQGLFHLARGNTRS